MDPSLEVKPQHGPLRAYARGATSVSSEPQRKSIPAFAVLGVVTLLVGAGIVIYASVTANRESTDDAQVDADVVPLAARVGGQVSRVMVIENQRVRAGDVIIQIDPVDFQTRVNQAEADLAIAQAEARAADAQVEVVEASARGGLISARAAMSGSGDAVSEAQAQVTAAVASVARRTADLHKAETDLGRSKELYAANAVSKEVLDNAQSVADAARASFESAQDQLSAAMDEKRAAQSRVQEARGRLNQSAPIVSTIAVVRAKAELAHAQVHSSEAALALAKNQLAYTTLVAPTDGVVSELGVHAGQLIQPGQPVAELVPRQTYLVASFKETQIGRMRAGQRVEATIDAFPKVKLQGRVESLSWGTGARLSILPPDNASGNFVKVVQRVPVRIAWLNPPKNLPLRAGLSGEVTIYLN